MFDLIFACAFITIVTMILSIAIIGAFLSILYLVYALAEAMRKTK